jgi:hypothetical protein
VTDIGLVLDRLHKCRVDFMVVGGVAATAHGSARVTYDIDILYSRLSANITRLVEALRPLSPYLRGAPVGLPFAWDAKTVQAGLNFTLTTSHGSVDLLGEMAGVGRFEDARAHATPMRLTSHDSLVIDLPWLIKAKRAAGRPKDLEVLAELELLQDLGDADGASPPAK